MNSIRPIPETILVISVASLVLAYCQPAPTPRESVVITPAASACAGARLDAAVLGSRAQIGYSRDDRFVVLDFERGRLEGDRDELVTGGAPAVSISGSTLCVAGTLESADACLVEVWRLGLCFELETPSGP